jgi:hypothetical protein
MIASSPHLAAILGLQCVGLLSYNYAGMNVTGLLGAVFRTVRTPSPVPAWVVAAPGCLSAPARQTLGGGPSAGLQRR